MIIFINGPFGIGKTSVAERLVQQVPDSILFDPEEVGFFLRKILGEFDPKDDFQDYTMWRTLFIDISAKLLETYGRTLVIPMTFWRKEYVEEVMGGLRKIEPNLHHFCLMAPIETIHDRLWQRGEKEGSWGFNMANTCVTALKDDIFDIHIDTTHKTLETLVKEIKEFSGITA